MEPGGEESMSKLIRIANTDYYAQSRDSERQLLTIIGTLPEGWESPRQSITVASRQRWGADLAGQRWEPATVNAPAIGAMPVEETEKFIRVLKFAVREADRMNREVAKLNANGPTKVIELRSTTT